MRLIRFDDYTFPLYNKRDQFDTGFTGGALVDIVDGAAYDSTGTGIAPEAVNTITTSYEIIATTASVMQVARDAIRALAGTRGRLVAEVTSASNTKKERWVWARLSRLRMERRREYVYYQPVEATFELAQPGWNGDSHGVPWKFDDGWELDDGLFLDYGTEWLPAGTPESGVYANDGNCAQTDIAVVVTTAATPLTSFTLVCGSCDWTFSGTVAANKALVIDCGKKSVKNNGADAYVNFTLNANHAVADWLRLEPGNNTVTLTYTGSGISVAINYYDKWM